MADRIVTQLQALKAKIESARDNWEAYITSLRAEPPEIIGSATDALQSASIFTVASRVTAIDAANGFLQRRLKTLSDRHYMTPSCYTLSSTARLIAKHLPSETYGLETANTFLHRAFTSAEMFLSEVDEYAAIGEGLVLLNFDRVHVMAKRNIDALSQNSTRKLAKAFTALTKFADERGGLNKFPEPVRETHHILSQWFEYVEAQVLLLMKCSHFLGANIARQRLLTEFFEGPQRDELAMVEAAFTHYKKRALSAATFLKTLGCSGTISGDQRLITKFFGRVPGKEHLKKTDMEGADNKGKRDDDSGDIEGTRAATSSKSLSCSAIAGVRQRLITEFFHGVPDVDNVRDMEMED